MTCLIQNIQGHQAMKTKLAKLLEQDCLPYNLLFLGPSGIGKSGMALALTQCMLCEKPISFLQACGQCGPCLRIASQQSESLCYIAPEKNIIGVEQAKSIIDFLQFRALGKAKVVIVKDAECLNLQASNILLKTLEEPPHNKASQANTYFIFITNSRGHILPTLNSRFQSLVFSPLSPENLQKIMQKDSLPDWMLKSCQGRADLLHQFLNNSHLRQEAIDIFENLFQSYISDAFLKIKQQTQSLDRLEALWVVTYLGQFLRDILLLRLGYEDLMNKDLKPHFVKVSGVPNQKLFELFKFTLEMTYRIEGYVDRALLFEELALKSHS